MITDGFSKQERDRRQTKEVGNYLLAPKLWRKTAEASGASVGSLSSKHKTKKAESTWKGKVCGFLSAFPIMRLSR